MELCGVVRACAHMRKTETETEQTYSERGGGARSQMAGRGRKMS